MQKNLPNTKIETYTHSDSEENPVEVILIGIEAKRVGSENSFHPPDFNLHHITTWLRKRYFILNGTIFAQIPRRTDNFAEEAREQLGLSSCFATDVAIKNGREIEVYYPETQNRCICAIWDIKTDSWTMKKVDQTVSGENIDADYGYAKTSYVVWKSP